MARSYSASERGTKAGKVKPPPTAPSAYEELGLPSLVGVETSYLSRIFGKNLFQMQMEAQKKLDEIYLTNSPERQAALEKLWDWENSAEKYLRYIDKKEREVARQEKNLKKYNQEQNQKRIRAISETMLKSLKPQELAMADAYERRTLEEIERIRDIIEEYDGMTEKMPKSVEDRLLESPYVKTKDVEENYHANYYKDAEGNRRRKMEVKLASGTSPASVRKSSEFAAHMNILEFTDKLVEKTEEIAGNGERLVGEPIVRKSSADPWANSTIEIQTNSRKIVWETNMIINRSKLGKNFNQWPTRLISNEPIKKDNG